MEFFEFGPINPATDGRPDVPPDHGRDDRSNPYVKLNEEFLAPEDGML